MIAALPGLLLGSALAADVRWAGFCDASAVAEAPGGGFLVANDEDDRLYRFDPSGAPAGSLALGPALGLGGAELDLEGAAPAPGGGSWWIGSLGRSKTGEARPERRRLILVGADLSVVGGADPLPALLEDPAVGPLLRAAEPSPPKAGGINVEALAADDAGRLWLGLRSPLDARGRALLLRLDEPEALLGGGAASVGARHWLDLGGRGLRAMVRQGATYLLVAGPSGGGGGDFALYRWTPGAEPEPLAPLEGLRPEAIAITGEELLMLSDDGTERRGGAPCKALWREDPARPEVSFRARTLPLPPAPPWAVLSETPEHLSGRSWRRVELAGALDGGTLTATGTVWLYTPEGREGAPILLGLPGWKFSSTTWEERAAVGALADRYGFRLALADMNTSIYASSFYPETAADFRWCGPDCGIPGARWVGEVLAPWLRTAGPIGGIFGLSTGARGAVLVPQLYEGLTDRVCAMSGTFDLFALSPGSGEYQIHQVIYGPRDVYPERWRRDDSLSRADQLGGLSVLLIHGGLDTAVPPTQSEALAAAMEARGLPVGLTIDPAAGHSWALWERHLPECFAAFAE